MKSLLDLKQDEQSCKNIFEFITGGTFSHLEELEHNWVEMVGKCKHEGFTEKAELTIFDDGSISLDIAGETQFDIGNLFEIIDFIREQGYTWKQH